jgi:hypothetical protein
MQQSFCETVYIAASEYFPQIKVALRRNYCVKTNHSEIMQLLNNTVKNKETFVIFLHIKKSLESRDWSTFKNLSRKERKLINQDLTLYAVLKHIVQGDEIVLIPDAANLGPM